MKRLQSRWRALRDARALSTLREIEQSIGALGDEDLLDLEDIFATSDTAPLGRLARSEMARRGLRA
jgi:hypothetical protein